MQRDTVPVFPQHTRIYVVGYCLFYDFVLLLTQKQMLSVRMSYDLGGLLFWGLFRKRLILTFCIKESPVLFFRDKTIKTPPAIHQCRAAVVLFILISFTVKW